MDYDRLFEALAKGLHELKRGVYACFGDAAEKAWDDDAEEEKDKTRKRLRFFAENPDAPVDGRARRLPARPACLGQDRPRHRRHGLLRPDARAHPLRDEGPRTAVPRTCSASAARTPTCTPRRSPSTSCAR
jgi:hypothetical protein